MKYKKPKIFEDYCKLSSNEKLNYYCKLRKKIIWLREGVASNLQCWDSNYCKWYDTDDTYDYDAMFYRIKPKKKKKKKELIIEFSGSHINISPGQTLGNFLNGSKLILTNHSSLIITGWTDQDLKDFADLVRKELMNGLLLKSYDTLIENFKKEKGIMV